MLTISCIKSFQKIDLKRIFIFGITLLKDLLNSITNNYNNNNNLILLK